LLYNYKDKPIDLYNRLKINVDLCEELEINIYSFPMKYHPITKKTNDTEDYSHNRDYIGKHWNRKYIRAVQAVLNSTKGKIGRGKSFFYEAFGHSEEEFFELLEMPETFIIYRFFFKWLGEEKKHPASTLNWRECFNDCMKTLSADEKRIVLDKIHQNIFTVEMQCHYDNPKMNKLLDFYTNYRKDIITPGTELYKLKQEYDNLPDKKPLRRKKKS